MTAAFPTAESVQRAYDDLREAASELCEATVAEIDAIEVRKYAEAALLLEKIDGKNEAQRQAQMLQWGRPYRDAEQNAAGLKRKAALRYELATIRVKELRDLIRLMELSVVSE